MDRNLPSESPARGAALARLTEVMKRLLAPGGCPWDREQTLVTLRPFLVEETYEVLEAIDANDPALHCEELGDLLFQIVFQAELAAEAGQFTLDDVIHGIADKLERRHPHVFGAATGIENSEQVLAQWDAIKRAEKTAKAGRAPRTLDGVPVGLPALARAQKTSHKAAKVGFDWPTYQGSLDKITEETREVAEAAAAQDAAAMHHEVGDLLFAAVNLARKLNIDAEQALRDATSRFTQRFAYIEDTLVAHGRSPAQSTLEEMDALWNEAKRALGKS